MSYSALFNSGFRHLELAEEAKSERYQHPSNINTVRPSRSASSPVHPSHRHRNVPPQGPIPSILSATDPSRLYVPRRPFADTHSVHSSGPIQDDVISVKSWNPPSSNSHRRPKPSRRSVQPNGMLSPHQTLAPPMPRASQATAPTIPPWQHTRQDKRRSFSFLYMNDSPLDAAEEEDDKESEHSIPQHAYAQPISPPSSPLTITRPRRQSYASTTAAKRPPAVIYPEPYSPAPPSMVEQKRKQSVFSRIFHRKGK